MSDSAEIAFVKASLQKRYGIEAAEIKLLDAGSTPNHFVQSASGSRFLVKALWSRLGEWVKENTRQVATLAAHAASNGLATPAPVRAQEGELVVVEVGPQEGEETHFVVFEWADGYVRADNLLAAQPDLSQVVLSKLGQSLASLHSMPLPEGITLPFPEAPGGHCLCDMGTFMAYASEPSNFFKGQESADAVWFRSQLPAVVDLWKHMPAVRVLCHGDAYLDNVLAKSKGTEYELLLVDWEDSNASHPVVDLAACAVGTCFTLTLGEDSEASSVELVNGRLQALLAGYQVLRPLAAEERALLRPAMQACAWACGAFRFGRYLDGVTDLKTRKYRELVEASEILEKMGSMFEQVAFA